MVPSLPPTSHPHLGENDAGLHLLGKLGAAPGLSPDQVGPSLLLWPVYMGVHMPTDTLTHRKGKRTDI